MLRTRRVGRVLTSTATVLVLGLSACGSTGPRITAGNAPTVLHLTSGQNGGGKALPSSASLDGVMRPVGNITYVFDGAFPDLGASGGSWSFAAGAKPDLARVAAIAKVLGVAGDVRTLPSDQGGGWAVGPNDGSAPTFMVSADGMLTWWYSSNAATVGSGCAVSSGGSIGSAGGAATATTAVASPPDQPVQPPVLVADTVPMTTIMIPVPQPCEAPPSPHGVPDKVDAEAKAKALVRQMGLDDTKYLFTSYADQYSASVSGQLLLDGAPSQISVSIGFGAEGAITYASGMLAEPQPGDVYPLVSADVGLQRLNDKSGKWQYFGSPAVNTMGGLARNAVRDVATSIAAPSVAPGAPATIAEATPTPSCVAPATTVTPSGTGPVDVAGAPCGDVVCFEPPVVPNDATNSSPAPIAPPCTTPTPPPVTVHLNAVKLTSTMVWAQDGTVWMLPAYTFTSSDGGEYTVVAVDEQYLDMPSTTVDTTVVGPGTTTDGVVPPVTAATVPGVTAVAPPSTAVAELLALASSALVGLTVDEAVKAAAGNGWQVRVVELDGVNQVVTADFQATRMDVAVKGGYVTSVVSNG
jgi:hypothetical protein